MSERRKPILEREGKDILEEPSFQCNAVTLVENTPCRSEDPVALWLDFAHADKLRGVQSRRQVAARIGIIQLALRACAVMRGQVLGVSALSLPSFVK